MKRFSVFCFLLLVSATAWAGVSYDFESVTSGGGVPAMKMSGRSVVDGANMRVDIKEGDGTLFQSGSIVMSTDAGKTLIMADPRTKTYYELPLEQLFSALGAMLQSMGGMMEMSIDNHKLTVTPGGPGESIEGYSTTKYTIDASYDVNIKIMGMDMNSHVESSSKVWATGELARDYMTFVQQRSFRTGIEGVDELIESQMAAMEGFPLKMVTDNKTTFRGRTQNTTTTMTISNIEKVSPPASTFEVPEGYRKGEAPTMQMPGAENRRR